MVLSHSLPMPFLSLAYKSQSRNLMSQVPPTFIINLTLLKIFPFFLANMVSCTVTSYGPQAAQTNEDSLSESSLNLTLTQHPRDEELEPREVHARLEVEPPRARYYRISPNSRTLMILLQVDPASGTNPKLSMKVVMKPKTLLSSLGLQFPVLDTIVGCTARFVDYLLIARRTT
jgi:hypothetical protein